MQYIIGRILRFTIELFDNNGLPVDADSLPNLSIRINQEESELTATPVKRPSTTGLYDVSSSLSGISNGDHIEILAKVNINSIEYQKAYEFVAVNTSSRTREIYRPEIGDSIHAIK